MNIGGVGAPMPADAVSGASPVTGGRFEGQLQSVMSEMTGVLGMSTHQLNSGIAQTGSLSSVAGSKGVSEQQLVGTIKQGLQDAGSKLTGPRLENIAKRIAHHRGVRANGGESSVSGPVSSTTLSPNTWRPTPVTNDNGTA
jgi:hypothetical protein